MVIAQSIVSETKLVNITYHSISQYFETIGIIYQLFSRFFSTDHVNNKGFIDTHNRFKQNLIYIQQNIDKEITIKELACKACLSSDHFTRSLLTASKKALIFSTGTFGGVSQPVEIIKLWNLAVLLSNSNVACFTD